MKSLLFVVGLAMLVAAALAFLRKKVAAGDSGPWPFHARKPLSVPEQILYFRLLEALPEHIVLCHEFSESTRATTSRRGTTGSTG